MANPVPPHLLTPDDLAAGRHRERVGGLWDEIGRLQFEFLLHEGLQPTDNLLDVGCGCLRGGVHFVRYLQRGRYYGIDRDQSLLDAGLDVELERAGLRGRLPARHLKCTETFDVASFGVTFDVALAQSLFSHLSAERAACCLAAVARVVRPGGRFFATFFEAPEGPVAASLCHRPGGVTTFPDRDPFQYRRSDFAALAGGLPWKPQYLGDWNHPRAQRMFCFERT
jgi:SAM-dependent methyltransferase